MSESSPSQNRELPGINLAYELVQNSYDRAVTRLNAVEGRIQAVMVFSASFVATAPVLVAASGNTISLNSIWFYIALGLAILNLIAGTIMRAMGEITLPGLNRVRAEWLVLTEAEFKLEAIRWGAEHFDKNVKTINRKGHAVILMTIVFLGQTLFLVFWGWSQVS